MLILLKNVGDFQSKYKNSIVFCTVSYILYILLRTVVNSRF